MSQNENQDDVRSLPFPRFLISYMGVGLGGKQLSEEDVDRAKELSDDFTAKREEVPVDS